MKAGTLIENSLQVVTFRVGNEDYGLHIMRVQEIIRVIEAVKVPKAPAYVEGVINLRGKIIPIIDLRKRMMKTITSYSDASRIIVVDTGGKLAGVVVDAVIDVLMLNSEDVESCPSIDDSKRSEYIMGVGRQGDRLITVLKLENLLKLV